MEAVDVLGGIDGIEHASLVNIPGQRELDEVVSNVRAFLSGGQRNRVA